MSISAKDIPFVPGTVFVDPRKQTFHKSHILDKTIASTNVNDEKALNNPIGTTSMPMCNRGTLQLDPTRITHQKTFVDGQVNMTSYYDPTRIGDRGAIACRKGLVTELPAGATILNPQNPFATMMSRNHDLERAYTKQVENFEPAFVKLDNVVLRFYAWTSQDVQESQSEKIRIRHVLIDYIVIDGTILIYERNQLNAGHNQGVILRRQKVPIDYKNQEAGYIQAQDLQVQKSIDIFAHTYNIYACSDDTRTFLENEGIKVAPNVDERDVPQDGYLTTRNARYLAETTKSVVTKHIADDKLAKYLRHDREVLNFYGYWDNRDAVFGEVRYFTIQYFLADDNIQVLEILPPNSGRDPFPVFVRKQKVPKQYKQTMFSETAEATQQFYQARDLKIGQYIDIFNRLFFLYDADEFTKQYMLNEFNYTPDMISAQDDRQQKILDNRPDINKLETLQNMTRLGVSKLFHDDIHRIGSEEDTIGSCLSVHPCPPKKNYIEFLRFGNLNIKFETKFVPYRGKPVHITNRDRRFILTYYFGDEQVSIYEVASNTATGFGNKFLERTKLKNYLAMEQQEADEYGRGKGVVYYTWKDFKPGNVIEVNGMAMEILRCEDKTQEILAEIERIGGLENFDPRLYKEA